MPPRRIQLRRSKGWRMPANTVKVDRSSRFGNPFRVGDPGIADVAASIERFKAALRSGELARDAESPFRPAQLRAALRGKNLACWCPLDGPCHADLLLKIANAGAAPKRVRRARRQPSSSRRIE
jgi:hypothetical protein